MDIFGIHASHNYQRLAVNAGPLIGINKGNKMQLDKTSFDLSKQTGELIAKMCFTSNKEAQELYKSQLLKNQMDLHLALNKNKCNQ